MKKFLVALFIAIVPMFARAACIPTQAVPGMAGCFTPLTPPLASTDYFEIWHPLGFPTTADSLVSVPALFAAPPPTGSATPNTGAFTTLSAAGAATLNNIIQAKNTTWSGGYPGTNNVALYSTQAYTGAPTGGGFPYTGGNAIVENLIYTSSDQMVWAAGGGVAQTMMKYQYGGGAASGDRQGFVIDFTQVGAMANVGALQYGAMAIFQGVFTDVTGAHTGMGNGLGQYNGVAVYFGVTNATAIHANQFSGGQMGFQAHVSGTTADYLFWQVYVNSANLDFTAYKLSYFLSFSQTDGNLVDRGILFGDPQAGSFSANGFPFKTNGTLIYSYAGTTGTGIDFSQVTFNTAVMLGPNFFQIYANNWVQSDAIHSATSDRVSLLNTNGTVMFSATGSGTLANNIQATGATTGNGVILASNSATDANVNFLFRTGGTSGNTPLFAFQNNAGSLSLLAVGGTANPVSGFTLTSASSGNGISLDVTGATTGIFVGTVNSTGVVIGNSGGTNTLNGGLKIGSSTGLSCTGTPTSSFATINGIVTHC